MPQRKPGHGRDDARLEASVTEQVEEALLDEDSVMGPRRVGIERPERQDLHGREALDASASYTGT
jgi:hypothetical protein